MSEKKHAHLIAEYFDEHAQSWHDYYQRASSIVHMSLIDRKNIALGLLDGRLEPGADLLDAGCGAGLQALELAGKGFTVHGVDISEKMIRIAEQNLAASGVPPERCSFRVGNVLAEAPPAEGSRFDAVLALGFLQYQVDEGAALKVLRANLKPGGLLVISGPTKVKLTDFFGWFKPAGRGAAAKSDPQARLLHTISVNAYSFTRFRQLLQPAGFDIVARRGHGFTNFRYFGRRLGFRRQVRLHRLLTRLADLLPPLQGYANDIVVLARRRA